MGQVVQTAKHAKIRHVPRQKPSAEALAAGFAHSARTCIVLREPFPKEKMIRFAISPDGLVTPDILENLPGRGALGVLPNPILSPVRLNKTLLHGRVKPPQKNQ